MAVEFDSLEQKTWNLGTFFGIDSSFLEINSQTVIHTWFVLLLLTGLVILCRLIIERKQNVARYLILSSINSFVELVSQTIGYFAYNHFSFIFSIFLFILTCNFIGVIPWAHEPTQDLNTTLGLALIAFFYKDFYAIKHQRWGYLKEFCTPFFLMFPINVIGHFSKIISLSFRLFGNIFAGSIIVELYRTLIGGSVILQTAGLISGLNFVILTFFVIFDGAIQAYVFAMLSLTYLALSIQEEHTEES
ncbi:MAG: F0F1 ATP synthase subunit A [Candidatus Babeliales bacterium]